MEKALADELKAEFISSDIEAANQSNALDLMSAEELEGELELLNCVETWLEVFIADYALDCSHTLIDEDEKEMVRAYWFSKGMEDTFVCINPRFQIKGFDADIPLLLLSQVAEHLEKLRTMLTSEGEREIKKWRTDGREGF